MFSGCSPHIHMISLYAYLLTCCFFSSFLWATSSSSSSAFYMFHKYAQFIWYLLLSSVTFWKYTLEVSEFEVRFLESHLHRVNNVIVFSMPIYVYTFRAASAKSFCHEKWEDEMLACDFTASAVWKTFAFDILHNNGAARWEIRCGGKKAEETMKTANNIIFNCVIIKNTCISIELWINLTRAAERMAASFHWIYQLNR